MTSCGVHKLIADIALFCDGAVLLACYADANRYDHQAGWFLTDDLLGEREHPDDAARRIAREQLGLSVLDLKLDHVESFTGHDGIWHLVFHYRAQADTAPGLRPSGDLAAAGWFPLAALPARADVAHHGWALDVLGAMAGVPA
jgi:ADP-ribose pyrophosphatase YjhB (NUDIX family)